jgi:hypothetical protein
MPTTHYWKPPFSNFLDILIFIRFLDALLKLLYNQIEKGEIHECCGALKHESGINISPSG